MTTTYAPRLTPGILAATNLEQLLDALRDTLELSHDEQGEIDMASLPLYGGDEPRNTDCIWSWDAESLIVGTCAQDFKIVGRAEYLAS